IKSAAIQPHMPPNFPSGGRAKAPFLSSTEALAGSEHQGAGLWSWLCSLRVFAPLFAKKGHTLLESQIA
ncbi:MAG: hypothetical protein AAFQ87_19405, partial [Bacteroidota bacterium]